MKGETVVVIEKTKTSIDPFGNDIYEEKEIVVNDVIVGSPSVDDLATTTNIEGKKAVFVLGIPKGDLHNWKDTEVIIRGVRYKTFGFPLTQTEANVPGRWNTQVKVALYE